MTNEESQYKQLMAVPQSFVFEKTELRDKFAMAALTGLLASGGYDFVVSDAYKVADRMLSGRNKPRKP